MGARSRGAAAAAVAAVAAALAAGAAAAPAGGTTLSVSSSDYGDVLVGPGGANVYMFGPDRPSESRCYGTCAGAWHPVLTTGKPRAGTGVRASLLGTTIRKDGGVQVNYNGHPLYFDTMPGESHRAGEIGCQHLVVNGGIWLIMKPNGQPNRSESKSHE